MNRGIKIFTGLLFSIIVFAAAFYFISIKFVKRPLPLYSGEISVKGISHDVKIFRDKYAVPYIYAENEEDAAFALGFVHAQERLFQMDLLRRAGEGRLSEVIGSSTVPVDKMFRTIGIFKNVKENYAGLSAETKRILTAYSKGVNEYINNAKGKLPIEFAVLNYEPYKWEPEHSLVISKLMAWELNISWWTDIAYTHIVQQLGEAKALEIIPDYPQNAPVILPAGIKSYAQISTGLIQVDRQFRDFIGFTGTHIGSNSWVVNGNMSVTGKPIIANDPHLALQAPGRWVVAVIRSGGWNAEGFTLPGIPAVVIGKNRDIAWGITNVMADDADFYIEKLDDAKTKYSLDGEWRDLKIINDSIEVKDSAKVYFKIKKTHRGPLITDIHANNFLLNTSAVKKADLSMRWTALETSDEFKGIFALNKAGGWDDFKSALKDFTAPGQNFVYSDKDGNIGYVCAAKLPVRNNNSPTFVYDGTTSANDWRGFVPYEEMPKIYNPPENFIATANNKTVNDFRYHISNLWEPTSRIERITRLLKSKQLHSKEDFKKYQMDFYSSYAEEICRYIKPAFADTKINDVNMKNAVKMLGEWDGKMDAQSQSPAVYAYFYQHLLLNIFKDEMGEQLFNEFVFMANIPYRVVQKLMRENKSSWFDDVNTPQVENRDAIIRKSLADAMNDLEKLLGTDMQKWQWGEVHKLTFQHLFHGQSKLFDRYGDIGEFGIGGDGTTVFNTEYSFVKPFQTRLGPSMRFLFDFSRPDEFEYILPTGQSGHLMSPHYKDMTKEWMSGQMIKVGLKEETIHLNKLLTLKQ
jgi:penicillin amidase